MKTIPNFSRYQIDESGTIYDTQLSKIVPPRNNGNNYYVVSIRDDNGEWKKQYIHRLVAITYLDNPTNLPTVNHKDENKANNHVSNLEWCSYQYNENYGTAKQRMVETRRNNGSYNTPKTALKVQMLDKNTKEILKEFDSIKAAGVYLGKSATHINEAAHGKRKSAYGYLWALK